VLTKQFPPEPLGFGDIRNRNGQGRSSPTVETEIALRGLLIWLGSILDIYVRVIWRVPTEQSAFCRIEKVVHKKIVRMETADCRILKIPWKRQKIIKHIRIKR